MLFPALLLNARSPLTGYLQHGFIHESLRMSDSVIARFPRIAPTETVRYKDHILPPGVNNPTQIDDWRNRT